ncbi:hypothetical protein JJJ17_07165 [Paracoccus caeni]|uniref:Uncharacterized protein n=1 Tax=Paracoccus caeni TaxID=657651 RepID=A0A934W0D6_9RHOB|nr:hypothetical protein [Paracoccus caeni]MBK4215699.1 hypothetical protein [Paracoccus caeni]
MITRDKLEAIYLQLGMADNLIAALAICVDHADGCTEQMRRKSFDALIGCADALEAQMKAAHASVDDVWNRLVEAEGEA